MTGDRCHVGLYDCGRVVAWWRDRTGHSHPLCRGCLHVRLDNADTDPSREPRDLWFIDEGSVA